MLDMGWLRFKAKKLAMSNYLNDGPKLCVVVCEDSFFGCCDRRRLIGFDCASADCSEGFLWRVNYRSCDDSAPTLKTKSSFQPLN